MTLLTLEPQRDERPVAYAVVVVAALTGALLTARVELVAVAAPFALSLLLARRRPSVAVDLETAVDGRPLLEGDVLPGRLTIIVSRSLGVSGLTVEAMIDVSDDLRAPAPAVSSWEHVGDLEETFTLRAQRWGRYVVGPTSVRVRDPDALNWWESTRPGGPEVRVLPTAVRLDRILEPRSSRTTAGQHPARRALGRGLDFAELHWYQPGDRWRDLNRRATARSSRPIVNRYHPERSGEVIIALDTLVDSATALSEASRRALIIETRATWALARATLTAQDRVGLVTLGRLPIWLPPVGGRRAQYAILEALLSVGGVLDGLSGRSDWLDASRIPSAAVVVLVSPLWSDRFAGQLVRLRARGRETAVIQLDTDALLGPPPTAAAALARRVFSMTVGGRADALRRAGITVVRWDPAADLGTAIAAAARAQLRGRSAS